MKDELRFLGMGLFSFNFVLILLGVVPPSEDPWVIVNVINPVAYYSVSGILAMIGLFLMGCTLKTGGENDTPGSETKPEK